MARAEDAEDAEDVGLDCHGVGAIVHGALMHRYTKH